MNKILVEVKLPAANKTFDVFIPEHEIIEDITEVIKTLFSDLSEGLFNARVDSVLCYSDSGVELDADKTPFQLGVKNGTQLLLI